MSLIIPLIAAGLVLLFWRQVLILFALVIIALVFAGIVTMLHMTSDSTPFAAVASTTRSAHTAAHR